MIVRIILTLTAWFIGISSFKWDGQTFTNDVSFVGSCLVTLFLWLPTLVRRGARRWRFVAAILVVLNAALIGWIAMELPHAYEYQKRFNEQLFDERGRFVNMYE